MIRDNTSNILNVHYDPFYPYNQSFLFFRLIIVYHTSQCRTSVLCSFSAIHLPPVEEGEFLLTFVKIASFTSFARHPISHTPEFNILILFFHNSLILSKMHLDQSRCTFPVLLLNQRNYILNCRNIFF